MQELITKHIEEYTKQHGEGANRQLMLEGAVQALQALLKELEDSQSAVTESSGKEL